MEAFFKTSKHLSPVEFIKIREELSKECNKKVKISLDQSGYAQELRENSVSLEQHLKDFLILSEPTVMPFVKGAQITLKDNLLEIVFETEMGENIFGVMNLGRLAERFLCDTYGIQVAARTTVSGEAKRDVYKRQPPGMCKRL